MMTSSPARPDATEYAPYFQSYISLVTEPDIMVALQSQLGSFQMLAQRVRGELETQIQAPYSWTIRQVVGHLIDTERILAYRALRFAVGDTTPLAGFDQDAYVAASDYSQVTLPYLTEEMFRLRQVNLSLFARFTEAAWKNLGEADGKPISVRAIAYVMAGHVRHHLRIVEQRVTQATGA
jgi:hypothetical protein